jgi:hypothetical protein
MKRVEVIISVFLLLLLGMTGCGGSDESVSDSSASSERKISPDTRASTQKVKKERAEVSPKVMKKTKEYKVTITPDNPTVTSTITASVNLSPEEENPFELSYVFWVDVTNVQEGVQNTLNLSKFKKGNIIYVDALFSKNGKLMFRRRSDMVQILNSSPRIMSVDFPEIRGPGTHQIAVKAEDADGDKMAFSLEGENIPSGVTIDPESGTISFLVLNKPIPKLDFFVVVKDEFEGESKQKVSLSLKAPPKEEEEE